MGLRCYCWVLLLGVSVSTGQYQDGPPAEFYGPPIVQQAIVTGPASLPVVGSYDLPAPLASGASFEVPAPLSQSPQALSSPAPVVETVEEVYKSSAMITEMGATSQSKSEQSIFESPAAPPQIPFEVPASPSAPEIPQLNAPAEIYGLPGVVTEIMSPPSQPDLPQLITPVLPQAPAEIPIILSTADLDAHAEINKRPEIVAEFAQPSPPEVQPFESPALQPQQAPHEILRPSPLVPVYGVPAEVSLAEHLQITGTHPPSLSPIETPVPKPIPVDKPAPLPSTPVKIPAEVYGPPTSENEVASIPPSPPVLSLPSSELSQASVDVHGSSAAEQEILVSPPSAPLLPPLLASPPHQSPAISEFPVRTPETVPHVYGPPIISRKIAISPSPLLKLQSFIFPLKIKIAVPWIPIPKIGIPADVYGPPQDSF